MSDSVTNELLLERLERLQSSLSEIKSDIHEIRHCLGSVANGQTSLSHRVEDIVNRVKRLERRSWWERPLADD